MLPPLFLGDDNVVMVVSIAGLSVSRSRLLKSMLRKTWAVSSGIPLTSLRQSQPSMRFECVVVAGSPGYLNFPPIFVFYERDSGAMLSTNNQSESRDEARDQSSSPLS